MEHLPRDTTGNIPYVFPGKRVKTLSNMAMIQLPARRAQRWGVTVHGFRAAFSTAENLRKSTEIGELYLGAAA